MYNSPNFFIKNTPSLLITPFALTFKNDFLVGDRNRNLLEKIETERIGGGGSSVCISVSHLQPIISLIFLKDFFVNLKYEFYDCKSCFRTDFLQP